MMLIYEATQDIRMKPHEIQTPLTTMMGTHADEKVGLVPILRAGLGMVDVGAGVKSLRKGDHEIGRAHV